MERQERDLIITAPVARVFQSLAPASMLALLIFGLNTFMDTIWVGVFLDAKALAAIGIAAPFSSLLMGIGSWLGTGLGTLISVALGAKDESSLARLNGLSFYLSVLGSLAAWSFLLFSNESLTAFGFEAELTEMALAYLDVCLYAAPVWIIGFGLNYTIRAEGKVKQAAWMMLPGLGLNLVLSPILLEYTGLGLSAAAWGTNAGMLVTSLVHLYYFRKLPWQWPAWTKSSFLKAKEVIQLGFPSFLNMVMSLLQASAVYYVLGTIANLEEIALYTSLNRMLLFLLMPLVGIMRALSPAVGINYGAQEISRLKAIFWYFSHWGLGLMLLFLILSILFGPTLSRLIMGEQYALSPQDQVAALSFMASLLVYPYLFNALSFVTALKKEKHSMIIGMSRQFLFFLPLVYFGSPYFGFYWIFYATLITEVLSMALALGLVWKNLNGLERKALAPYKLRPTSPMKT